MGLGPRPKQVRQYRGQIPYRGGRRWPGVRTGSGLGGDRSRGEDRGREQVGDVAQPQPVPLAPWMNRNRSTAPVSYARYPAGVSVDGGNSDART